MIVPFTQRPATQADPSAMPSQTQLLMAAAEMHQQGRLADQDPQLASDMAAFRGISKMVDPKRFEAAVQTMPKSENIDDRRTQEGLDQDRQDQREMNAGRLYQTSTKGRKARR